MSAYEFKKGLGLKITQPELNAEYKRLYKNLKTSYNRYKKQGVDVDWFVLPQMPKKITEGSIRKLKNKINEWRYYTGQPADASKLSSKVGRTGEDYYKNIRRQSEKIREQNTYIENLRQEYNHIGEISQEELEAANKDNPWYEKAIQEGVKLSDLPNVQGTKLLKLYELCYLSIAYVQAERYAHTNKVHGAQRTFYSAVIYRAEVAISRMTDVGGRDVNEIPKIEYRLSVTDFASTYNNLYNWIWSSKQSQPYLQSVIDVMTRGDVPFEAIKRYAEDAAEMAEDIEMYF